jgi:tRNA(adenine34) deaminase
MPKVPTDPRVGAPTDAAFDDRMMAAALEQARGCAASDDVPIGAVVSRAGEIVARGANARERLGDPTAHAEVIALRDASRVLGTWRLGGCSLYVTLEPCAMCAGALVLARIDRLVFGADDPKAGFAGSVGDIARHERLNHRVPVTSGVLAAESAALLRAFFADRR